MSSRIVMATPVLRVADVAKSMAFYRDSLGLIGDPFPDKPPFEFAILRSGTIEIMLRRGKPRASVSCPHDWDIYLRLEGRRIRELFAQLASKGIVTRRLERMFYGQAEFEITDPDGYAICVAEALGEMGDLPSPSER
jgi:uncharacterized glyoxalase superfamily protein PhnB